MFRQYIYIYKLNKRQMNSVFTSINGTNGRQQGRSPYKREQGYRVHFVSNSYSLPRKPQNFVPIFAGSITLIIQRTVCSSAMLRGTNAASPAITPM